MLRQRFVGLSVLALFVSIGFWAANALSLPYDYCDKTITAGYSCGAASNCSTSGCNGLGVKCEVTTVKQGTCLPGGFVCFTVNTCAGYCGGTSPACTCPGPVACQ